ncbi:MAG TPA: hypothetical protein VFN57_16405 [Thermomicrobiaceae bacterium]|nr:hypothetical protein [Thermomicrobiaceae bacterium]
MSTIHGHHGEPVAWFEDDVVYAPDGTILAWVQDGNVFDARGRQIGRLERGLFHDRAGRMVGFVQGASDRAPADVQELPDLPTPPMPLERPSPPRLVATSTAPPREEWAGEEWSHYVAGDQPSPPGA